MVARGRDIARDGPTWIVLTIKMAKAVGIDIVKKKTENPNVIAFLSGLSIMITSDFTPMRKKTNMIENAPRVSSNRCARNGNNVSENTSI